MQFVQLTRELEVKVYKGLPSTETFKFLFNYVSEIKSSINAGWKADNIKNTSVSFPFRVGNQFCERKTWT